MEPRIIQGSSKDHQVVQTWRKQQAEDVPCEATKTSPSCSNCLALMDIGVLKGLKHPDCVIHTLKFLFDHFPRFFMFLMIVFPTSKHCFRSHGVFLRAADLGSMAAQVPAGGEAKPHGQDDFVFRASDFSADLMIGKNQQNCRFYILR